MNSSLGFYLKITGPGLVYEREISVAEATRVMTSLFGLPVASSNPHEANPSLVPSVTPQATAGLHPSENPSAPKTARGYLNTYEPKRVPDKIACLALYLREIEQRREFSRDDLKRVFQAAAERIPANLGGRDLQWAQQVDWVAPSSTSKDLFFLTHPGEEAVRSAFSDKVLAKTRLRLPTQRRRNDSEPEGNSPKLQDDTEQPLAR